MDGMYAAGEIRLNISDIQHYSTGDGDGIRTTVFFKGCKPCPIYEAAGNRCGPGLRCGMGHSLSGK